MIKFESRVNTTKSGKKVIIRSALKSDAASLLSLAKQIIAEDKFQLLTLDELEISINSEESWIESFAADKNRIILVAEIGGTLVGSLDFCNGHRKRISHTGEFEMSVWPNMRSQGIGTLLLESLLSWAADNHTIEKINLNVHSNNDHAIALYKKAGFCVEGIKKKEIKYDNGLYIDTIVMGRFV